MIKVGRGSPFYWEDGFERWGKVIDKGMGCRGGGGERKRVGEERK